MNTIARMTEIMGRYGEGNLVTGSILNCRWLRLGKAHFFRFINAMRRCAHGEALFGWSLASVRWLCQANPEMRLSEIDPCST